MSTAIELRNVWKKFKKGEKFNSIRDAVPNFFKDVFSNSHKLDQLEDKEFWATQDVSLKVEHGDVVGIIGPNGAGKSTILKLLSRIMNPTKGSVMIDGRLSALIEVTAGFHPELTGRENIYLNGTILGMNRKELDEKFEQIVDFSGVGEFIDTPVKRYSSGMFSRLGFSVAAHVDPDILLVDEVLAVGDIAFQSKCAQKMRDMLKSGVTIVLVSHNLALIQNLCKRVVLLEKGKIIQDGSPEEVIPSYENIVFKQKENELKKQIHKNNNDAKHNSDVDLKEIYLTDEQGNRRDKINIGEMVVLNIAYHAKQRIENPVFVFIIVRSDGIACFSSNSRDEGYKIDSIDGDGIVKVELGKLELMPNIYVIRASVWDQSFLGAYVIRSEDTFSVEANTLIRHKDTIYHCPIKWRLDKEKD